MNTTKLTRDEALRRWNASKETKRKMVEKLETLVRNSCLERGDLENLKQHMMEKIIVDVAWCDRNYGGSLGSNVPGAVVFTAPTFEALQKEAKESLEFHIEGLVENGEDVPEWLKNGDYEFVYNPQIRNLQGLVGFCLQRDKIHFIVHISCTTEMSQTQNPLTP